MSDTAKTMIRYEVTIDDLVAFNVSYMRTSSMIRSMQRRQMLVGVPLAFVGTFGLTSTLPHFPGIVHPLIMATAAALWTAGYLSYYYRRGYINRVRKLVTKVYSEGKSPGLLGEHVLQVDENGFTDRTKFNESRYAWGGLMHVEGGPGHTYLYIGAANALIIPHAGITDGDFPALLEQVKMHYRPDAALSA